MQAITAKSLGLNVIIRASKEEVELCHKNGIEVNVWTINNMDDLENMYEWGCDGVITNYPDVCKSWLKAKKAKG